MKQNCALCVIDDVKSVVEGISKVIPWTDHGIDVVGTALDGEEGLRLVRETQPDVILTDIRMPNLDGLEMLEKLRDENYVGKVIFFTGYNDFEYAKQAIRLGAFDYIMKPHSADQILQVVLKAKLEMEAHRAKEQRIAEIQNKLKESLPILRQEFFHLLIHHRTNEERIQKRWDFLQIDLDMKELTLMIIEMDNWEEQSLFLSIEEVELMRFSLQNIVEETVQAHTKGLIFRDTASRFVVIYQASAELPPSRVAEQCCEHVASYTKFTVTIGQSRKISHAVQLMDAYREALFALSYQFYEGGNVVLLYDDVVGGDRAVPRYSSDREQELTLSLRSGNFRKSKDALEAIFQELSSGGTNFPDPMHVMFVYYELATRIVRVLLEKVNYTDIEAFDQKLHDRTWLISAPLKELQQVLLDLCKEGCSRIESSQRTESERTIDQAIAYIQDRLHLDLTVGECAKHVHVSGNYFVHLFKKVTGMTFVQFVTQERMEKAKIMLLDGRLVQDIAAEVGYEDRRYFSDVFKKTFGMTPSEYRDQYLNQPESRK
ncbi:response regulator [Paenibacillus hexagrammi]|uniref:Response regulator n=1 Tax=Paenibacillus hexagrammi TaxID=2908839 RepID=A0ABY3SCL4_9BACL|nr:response regulator [Paenibacillus sp. YPD9-1]UJF31688.1 response regulator [Paenibacillus sp. YPD9-1]